MKPNKRKFRNVMQREKYLFEFNRKKHYTTGDLNGWCMRCEANVPACADDDYCFCCGMRLKAPRVRQVANA